MASSVSHIKIGVRVSEWVGAIENAVLALLLLGRQQEQILTVNGNQEGQSITQGRAPNGMLRENVVMLLLLLLLLLGGG